MFLIKNMWLMIFSLMMLYIAPASAQDRTVKGMVHEKDGMGALVGATVKTADNSIGTVTDENGKFSLSIPEKIKSIVVNYIGYQSDTLKLKPGDNELHIMLNKPRELDEVEVAYRRKGNEMSLLGTQQKEIISEREILKAACCNLSESFETTPSIDVSFTDAVSGYKQIQMLGLAGPYTLITRENIPEVRGLAAITGLTYTPGAWLEGMQLSKGTGSVVNGYESVAGQLNIELKKPFEEKEPKVYLNLYQNVQGRSEGNLVARHEFNEALSSNLLLHGSGRWMEVDMNNDGFMDQPQNKQFVGMNRWYNFGKNGLEIQGGIKGVYMDQTGGQLGFSDGTEQVAGNPWGYKMTTNRIEGFAKIGKMFSKVTSTGLQLSAVHHEQSALYGKRNYDAAQNTFYGNWIFQSIIGNTNHKIKAGVSTVVDNYDETFENVNFMRNEIVPGAFAEYAYNYLTKFNMVAGVRADYHNLFGFFVTPRLHMRYAPFERTAIRASIGRAQRTANIFAENIGYMATNRQFVINGNNADYPYGLNPEVAWNTGVNLTQKFQLNYRDGAFAADYYYTTFEKQVVVDVEAPDFVKFYNLNGSSFAHSFQTQLDYEPIRNFDVRLAYRWYDVQTTYSGILKQRPLVAKHRAFVNLGYETNNTWRFDYTMNWVGAKRIPSVYNDAGAQIASEQSPSYVQMNAQISKTWNEKLELYIGGENLTNYLQPSPIIGAANPFSGPFDASMVWGPVMGRNIYAGLRLKMN